MLLSKHVLSFTWIIQLIVSLLTSYVVICRFVVQIHLIKCRIKLGMLSRIHKIEYYAMVLVVLLVFFVKMWFSFSFLVKKMRGGILYYIRLCFGYGYTSRMWWVTVYTDIGGHVYISMGLYNTLKSFCLFVLFDFFGFALLHLCVSFQPPGFWIRLFYTVNGNYDL